MSQHFIDFEMLDFSGEKASFSVYTGAITPVSLPGFLSQLGNLRTALAGITKGTVRRERWTGDETILSSIPPSNSAAQVELAWRVFYSSDQTGKYYEVSIACPDPSFLFTGTDLADKTAPAMAAFVTAFETIARAPDDDSAEIIVNDIVLVGRGRR